MRHSIIMADYVVDIRLRGIHVLGWAVSVKCGSLLERVCDCVFKLFMHKMFPDFTAITSVGWSMSLFTKVRRCFEESWGTLKLHKQHREKTIICSKLSVCRPEVGDSFNHHCMLLPVSSLINNAQTQTDETGPQ